MSEKIIINDVNTSFKNDITPINDSNMNALLNGIRENISNIQTVNNRINNHDTDISGMSDRINNVTTYIDMLEDRDVVVKQPKFTVTVKDSNTNQNLKDTYEIGTVLNINYNISFDSGQYKYNDPISGNKATGVTATAYRVTVKGTNKTTQSGTFENVEVNGDVMISSTGNNYSNGNIPVSNLGRRLEEKQIKASNYNGAYINGTQSSSMTISPYRMGCFFGALTSTKTINELTSANIRDDLQTVEKDNMNRSINKSNKAFPTSGETFSFTIPAGAKSVVIACPKSTGVSTTYGPTYVLNSTVNAPMHELYGGDKIARIMNIDGNNKYVAEKYNVWIYTPSVPYTQNTKFTVTLGSLSI